MKLFSTIRRFVAWYSIVVLLSASALYLYLTWTILPSGRTMWNMNDSELRKFILKTTPIGTSKTEVEYALSWKFRRTWKEERLIAVSHMAKDLNFSVDVKEGDYFISSDFASMGSFLNDVITVRFLFDKGDRLKDVTIDKWGDAL